MQNKQEEGCGQEFLVLARKISGRANSKKYEFENQIYHIFQAILKKG